MSTTIKYPEVHVQLTGEDGNAFAIIAAVSRAMKQSGLRDEAADFQQQAMRCGSYDELLQLCLSTVEVS